MSKTLSASQTTIASQVVTPQLRSWIITQAQSGCRPEDVVKAMCASGWHEDVALQALEDTLLAHAQASSAQTTLPAPVTVPDPNLLLSPSVIRAGDRDVQVLLNLALPRVVLFGNFLSHEECDQLMALAQPRLLRSETVINATGGSEVNASRTSDGMFFARAEHELCDRIEQRIAALVNWPVENGEGLQVLRYGPGAEYRPHFDYFDPAQPGAPTILARGGQRVGTLVMYLSTVERGGGTTFPDGGLEVAPIKGNAVFFSYDRPHPCTRTLHGGAPVLEGEKWVATKWLRERRFE
jgi:prolyl 4-hydroxylase